MCGIAGVVDLSGSPVPEGVVPAMCQAIRHRGPDDEGYHTAPGVALGMRRLSIIDVGGGHQPISNEDDSVWVVFNGEVYNYHTVRQELLARGHRFRTHSDTETIVHAYEEYGLDFVQHLVGMFAIAIWDARARQLVLVRDRLGKKPVYYLQRGDTLAFGSELKCLLAAGLVERRVDLEALDEFLTFGYVGGHRSIFQGVHKLLPGHMLVASPERGVRVQRYWSVRFNTRRAGVSLDEAAEELRPLLEEAVRCRLESEVPLGAFLSGGVDSTTVVALASQMVPGTLKTFSIGFDEEDFDELAYARTSAERFGTDHHEFVVRPELLHVLPRLVEGFDEPFADPSMLPTYYVSKLTRDHVTVALSGDGGDEVFGGYPRYHQALGVSFPENLPPLPRHVLARLARLSRANFRGRQRLAALALGPSERYAFRLAGFPPDRRRLLYTREIGESLTRHAEDRMAELFGEASDLPFLSQMQYVDMHAYLPDDILVKVDRMSMLTSLEARAPLLDHRLVEFAASLPPSFLYDGRTGKAILKRAMDDIVPVEILRRAKVGFGTPLVHWFRGSAGELLDDLLLDGRLGQRGYFSQAEIARLVREHRAGQVNNATRLWTLVVLELWHRLYVDEAAFGPGSSAPASAGVA